MLIESRELKSRLDNMKLILRNKASDKDRQANTLIMGKVIGLEIAEMIIMEIETASRGASVTPRPEGQEQAQINSTAVSGS